MWHLARLFVLGLLVYYFITKIIDASTKLQEGELGISVERRKEELVEESNLISLFLLLPAAKPSRSSICPLNLLLLLLQKFKKKPKTANITSENWSI